MQSFCTKEIKSLVDFKSLRFYVIKRIIAKSLTIYLLILFIHTISQNMLLEGLEVEK